MADNELPDITNLVLDLQVLEDDNTNYNGYTGEEAFETDNVLNGTVEGNVLEENFVQDEHRQGNYVDNEVTKVLEIENKIHDEVLD